MAASVTRSMRENAYAEYGCKLSSQDIQLESIPNGQMLSMKSTTIVIGMDLFI